MANSQKPSDRAQSALKHSQLKLTRPRLAILKLLIEHHGPFTAEEIHQSLKGHRCNLATVYRTLEVFMDEQLVEPCHFGDGKLRYELKHSDTHHHHLICKGCGRIEMLSHCLFEGLNTQIAQTGYSDLSHTFEVFGLCPQCQKRK